MVDLFYFRVKKNYRLVRKKNKMTSTITFTNCESVLSYFQDEKVLEKAGLTLKVVDVEKVSGGFANFVFRLIFEDKSTLILKYYTTHLAADNSIEMSPHRYIVEKTALDLIGNETVLNDCRLSTPKVLFSDDDIRYFIMEDCGKNLVTLTDLLKLDFKLPESMAKKHEDDEEKTINEYLELLAKEIRKVLHKLGNESSIKLDKYRHIFADEEFLKTGIESYKNYIPQIFETFDFKEDPALYKPHIERNDNENNQFIHGDFWFEFSFYLLLGN